MILTLEPSRTVVSVLDSASMMSGGTVKVKIKSATLIERVMYELWLASTSHWLHSGKLGMMAHLNHELAMEQTIRYGIRLMYEIVNVLKRWPATLP